MAAAVDSGGSTGDTKGAPQSLDPRTVEVPSEQHANDVPSEGPWRFWYHVLCCSSTTIAVSALSIVLWSSMGLGKETITWLSENDWLWTPTTGIYCVIFLVLLPLDFFRPPHMPTKYCRLWESDRIVGRSLFAIAVVNFYASCLFMAESYPSVPLVMTSVLAPFVLVVVRQYTAPKVPVHLGKPPVSPAASSPGQQKSVALTPTSMSNAPSPNSAAATSQQGAVQVNLSRQKWKHALHDIVQKTAMVRNFYMAALISFFLAGILSLTVWLLWVLEGGNHFDTALADIEARNGDLSETKEEELYILWATPLIVAAANIVLGIFTGVRVFFHQTYKATRFDDLDQEGDGEVARFDTKEMMERQSKQHLAQLSMMVKLAGCCLILIIGLLWVAGQLLYADSEVSTMVMGLMGAFFLIFIVFTALSMKRVAKHLRVWFEQLPVWITLRQFLRSDWIRAAILGPTIPIIPFVLLMSAINHKARKIRKIYERIPEIGPKMEGWENMWLTPKFHNTLKEVRKWNWLSIILKEYILCILMFGYTVCPLLLNVTLSWFQTEILRMNLRFEIIVVITFFIGIVAFLLPPVPGLTIYLFGGLMMSATCPWGFWPGAATNIALGFFLKLCACAVQQKCIGGLLGNSLQIRQMVGVHKVFMRAIKAELERPGWSVGKVAILCGGPDWPTSVLAGMMKLSLWECEIGTIPIIFFIVPCSLSGSLYMKKGTSDVWDRSANFMILISVVVNLFLWAVAAWSIQNQLERNGHELTRPLKENVDLEWLDYKDAELAKTAQTSWQTVPKCIRWVYAAGIGMQIMVCQAWWWSYYSLFHHFEVSDNIADLDSWYGDKGIVTFNGLLTLIVYTAAWLPFIQFKIWTTKTTRRPRIEAGRELDKTEAQWKEDYLKRVEQEELRAKTKANPTPSEQQPTITSDPSGTASGTVTAAQEGSANQPSESIAAPSIQQRQGGAPPDEEIQC